MKRRLKRYTSLAHYIEFLRRQPRHFQHVYAAVFAGTITVVIAMIILYVDYGFWHEKYVKEELLVTATTTYKAESPTQMFSRFFSEAGTRFGEIKMPSKEMFQGKETYTNENK